MTLNEIIGEIYEVIGVDRTKFELKLKMKFPSSGGRYKVVNLKDDRALAAMWASVCHSNAGSMDLYVEIISFQTPTQSRLPPNPSFTSLLRDMSQSQVVQGSGCESRGGVGEVGMFVSLLTNNVDEAGLNGHIEGDEVEDGVDERLVDVDDDNHINDDGVDLVSPSAPLPQYSEFYHVDEAHVNKWHNCKVVVPYEVNEEFCVGQKFPHKISLTQAVTLYHLQMNQCFKVAESKPDTVTFKCGRKPMSCSWTLRASQKNGHSDVFTIVTYKGKHQISCVGDTISIHHPNITRLFISRVVRHLVEADWGLKIVLIQAEIKKCYNYAITYQKAWLAKQQAIEDIFGNWEGSYQMLPRYLQALRLANPGTIVHFVNIPTCHRNIAMFGRVFWAFAPCIMGFPHCRPIITIDGTHLYGKYKGVLMIAMGVDANDQLFPLAFAIVEKENNDTWSWFMCCIREWVTQRTGLCVISDRHAGIMNIMNDEHKGWVEPFAYHRFCIRHHASNINTRHKSTELKDLFSSTAFQRQPIKFTKGYDKIGELFPVARNELDKIPLSKWSICHDGGYRYGLKTSNLAESFNSVLKGARFLPITELVKLTFFRVNAYFVERRKEVNSRMVNGLLWSKNLTKSLNLNTKKAAHHKVVPYNIEDGLYGVTTCRGDRVIGKGNHNHTINLSQKTCTCNKWQIYHFPCSHVVAVCRTYNLSMNQYVDPYYSCREYLDSYSASFHPLPDEAYWSAWEGEELTPNPYLKRDVGRPNKRIRNEMDETSTRLQMTCSLCGNKGHNKRSCRTKSKDVPG